MSFDLTPRPELIRLVSDRFGVPAVDLQLRTAKDLRTWLETGNDPANPVQRVAPIPTLPPVPSATPQPQQTASGLMGIVQAIAAEITPGIMATVAESLRAEFNAAIENKPRTLEVTINRPDSDPVTIDAGHAHVNIPTILAVVKTRVDGLRVPAYLYGPAGSGKSTAARQIAKILGLPCYLMSFGPTSQMHELVGYVDGNGRYHSTPFRRAWEHGGVILLDEYDAASEIMIGGNAALANGHCTFPDVPEGIARHADCVIIAAGNTIGKGATNDYTSRARQDAATLNRFAFIQWGYDETLELAVAGASQTRWVKHVQALRRAHSALGTSAPDILITPRASIYGSAMLNANPDMAFEQVEDLLIWQGANDDDKAKVRAKVRA